jgi:hypothetical protein
MSEKEGLALPLTRFLAGAVGALFVQVPAVFMAGSSSSLYVWLQISLIGSALTGFLWMAPQRRAWAPLLAYAVGAGIVLTILWTRDKVGSDSLPMLGPLFGGWSLLAAVFVFDILRRRRAERSDRTWSERRQKSRK